MSEPIMERRLPAGTAVLISGAGFAGLATAYWLIRLGHRVTVVEVATALRRGGTPVDIEGETIDVLTRMGLIEAVRAKALPPRGLVFKRADDSTVGEMPAQPDTQGEKYEIHRGDLLDILFASVADQVELVFGRAIETLTDGPDCVAVTFNDDVRSDYGLVFGCDGNRSRTRRLSFGAVDGFSHFMGGYFCIKVVPATDLLPANVSEIFSVPGRTALLNGYSDQTDIAFAFRSNNEVAYDYRDRAHQQRMIHAHFDDLGWKVPAMLAYLDADNDFYFDRLNQIRMPAWSTGRIVLVGDAGYCVSPVAGMGGSMAIIGAARLADALQRHGNDHVSAFQEYYDRLHPFVAEVQEKAATLGMAMMFPSDDSEIAERNLRINSGSLDI